jgi:hypothetical protein
MKNRRFLWLAVVALAVVVSLNVVVSTEAFQRLCQWCFALECVDIAADGYQTCIQFSTGCIAFDQTCSAGLTITP